MKLKDIEQFAFKEVDLVAEMHLHEPELEDLERIDNEVRIVQATQTTEFGIESEGGCAIINAGPIKLTLDKLDLMKAFTDWIARDLFMEEMRKKGLLQ